ncbi:hypothetical protein [Eubacterium sp.]|mgnify:CR=1 FL=1|uniref:hypothetical protein n=1 Tax=Eubacterium sp. TaxID=142586 RepID=UPI00351FB3B6
MYIFHGAVNLENIQNKTEDMEKIQTLDMAINGLGNLTEYRLLVLLGNNHSLALVDGKDLRPDEIIDSDGRLLYPAYFMTHIKVPMTSFLEDYCLWEKVKSVVEVKRFSANLLDSHYSIQRCNDDGEVQGEPIIMDSNSMFIVDATLDKSVHRTSSTPQADKIAELDKMKKIPEALKTFRTIRTTGFALKKGRSIGEYSFQYKIVENRDVSINHSVIFAKFTEIMDMCEWEYLFEGKNIGLPVELSKYIHILDRETYFYSNCFSGDVIECNIKVNLEECEDKHLSGKKRENTCFYLHETFELYNEKTRNILVIAKCKKVICVPVSDMYLIDDFKRIIENKYNHEIEE